jgi:hypothetical protein
MYAKSNILFLKNVFYLNFSVVTFGYSKYNLMVRTNIDSASSGHDNRMAAAPKGVDRVMNHQTFYHRRIT